MCGDTCEDEEQAFLTGKARVKPVEIMDQAWCDKKLADLRHGKAKPGQTKGFWVFPIVYCVAYNETYQSKFFLKNGEQYQEVPPTSAALESMGRKDSFYIRATGSCKGDSGGPLYEKRGKTYIVIGTTSRGTGSLGNCGGRGNPTHYVRVQHHLKWISGYIQGLCKK